MKVNYISNKVSKIHFLLLNLIIIFIYFFNYFNKKNNVIVWSTMRIEKDYTDDFALYLYKKYIFVTFTIDNQLYKKIVDYLYLLSFTSWNCQF